MDCPLALSLEGIAKLVCGQVRVYIPLNSFQCDNASWWLYARAHSSHSQGYHVYLPSRSEFAQAPYQGSSTCIGNEFKYCY